MAPKKKNNAQLQKKLWTYLGGFAILPFLFLVVWWFFKLIRWQVDVGNFIILFSAGIIYFLLYLVPVFIAIRKYLKKGSQANPFLRVLVAYIVTVLAVCILIFLIIEMALSGITIQDDTSGWFLIYIIAGIPILFPILFFYDLLAVTIIYFIERKSLIRKR